jgi:hypothetical protein
LRGADIPAPLRTLTSPLSLFSKDMWSAMLHLGLAPILRVLNEGCGLPFIVLPRQLSQSLLHFTQGGRHRNFHTKAGHVA